VAIGYLLFEKMEDLQKGLATHGAEIMTHIPNFTNVQPQIQIGSTVLRALRVVSHSQNIG
jgi:hypothetical protein